MLRALKGIHRRLPISTEENGMNRGDETDHSHFIFGYIAVDRCFSPRLSRLASRLSKQVARLGDLGGSFGLLSGWVAPAGSPILGAPNPGLQRMDTSHLMIQVQ